jgi:hypothetical protein
MRSQWWGLSKEQWGYIFFDSPVGFRILNGLKEGEAEAGKLFGDR